MAGEQLQLEAAASAMTNLRDLDDIEEIWHNLELPESVFWPEAQGTLYEVCVLCRCLVLFRILLSFTIHDILPLCMPCEAAEVQKPGLSAKHSSRSPPVFRLQFMLRKGVLLERTYIHPRRLPLDHSCAADTTTAARSQFTP